jgi:adenylate cyclase
MSSALSSEQAPTGPMCCIFTDITDSTALWEHDQMAMQISLTIHNRIVRDEIFRFGGYEVKTTGDGFHLAFARAQSAMQFSLAVQETLKYIEWPKAIQEHRRCRVLDSRHIKGRTPGLAVGIGLHWGEPFSAEMNPITNQVDYYGPMVNKTARIQAEAGDDNISVSDTLIAQLELEQTGNVVLPDNLRDHTRARILRNELSGRAFEVRFKGERSLKGIKTPEYISLVSLKTTVRGNP